MNEYSIAFLGNITIYAESEAEARKQFNNAELRPWAEIDTVQCQAENVATHTIEPATGATTVGDYQGYGRE